MNHKTLLVVLIATVLCFSGCEKNEFGTLNITGTVSLDGAPTQGISISFIPKTSSGRECYGSTDAQGKYVMTIPGTEVGSGAMPGEYTVLFSKSTNPAEGLSEEEMVKKFPNGRPNDVELLPVKYQDRNTTDIPPVMVEKGKKNEFNFDLTSK